jgi:hypothetical protein
MRSARKNLEQFSLSGRSNGPARMFSPVAGVLLGKTRLNSIYGALGGLPQTVPPFGYADSARFLAPAAPNE